LRCSGGGNNHTLIYTRNFEGNVLVGSHGRGEPYVQRGAAELISLHGEHVITRHKPFQPVLGGCACNAAGCGDSVRAECLHLRLCQRPALRINDASRKTGGASSKPIDSYY